MARQIGNCSKCQQEQSLGTTTTDCACLVCEQCANDFMETRRCGVCKTFLYDMMDS